MLSTRPFVCYAVISLTAGFRTAAIDVSAPFSDCTRGYAASAENRFPYLIIPIPVWSALEKNRLLTGVGVCICTVAQWLKPLPSSSTEENCPCCQ